MKKYHNFEANGCIFSYQYSYIKLIENVVFWVKHVYYIFTIKVSKLLYYLSVTAAQRFLCIHSES